MLSGNNGGQFNATTPSNFHETVGFWHLTIKQDNKNQKIRRQQQSRASWSKSCDLPLIRPPVECEQIRLVTGPPELQRVWVSPTSRGVDGEQIPWTLPRWSQLSCQRVCNWNEARCLVTQDTACLWTKWKTSIISGFQSVFWGASVWTYGRSQKDEKRERGRDDSHNDGVWQFDFTVKSFPGIIVRGEKKHDRGLLQTLLWLNVWLSCWECPSCAILCVILRSYECVQSLNVLTVKGTICQFFC